MNENKMEYIRFKRERAISSLSGGPLKLVDQFVYLSSCVLSTKTDIDIHFVKVLIAIDRPSIIWKFDLFNKIKRDFFQAVAMSILQ